MSSGAATAFAGIWLSEKGLSPEQIGVVNALPIFALLIISLTIGRIADRADDWRQVIIIGALAGSVFPLGLFFVNGFWGILLFWSLAAIAQAATIPVADAAAMRFTRREGGDFGAVRAWGTVGYLLVIFLTGYLVKWFGSGMFLPLFVGVIFLRAAASLCLPNFRAPKEERAPSLGANRLLQVMKPWFILPLLGWAIVFSTHLILNAFQSLLFSKQGISPEVIGILIALGAISETIMFFLFKRFSGKFPARYFILLSSVVTVLRWIAMSYAPGVPVLIGLQMLHSVTYALGFLGCINFIANWTSEDIAAEAQSFFGILQQGMAVLALTAFGGLAGVWGAKAYLASAAFAALGAFLVWVSLQMKQPNDRDARA